MIGKFTEQDKQILRDCANRDPSVSKPALATLTDTINNALALELPLRKGIQPGDIISGIFETLPVENGRSTFEYPLHFMSPGEEGEYVGFTMPFYGSYPQRIVSGDFLTIPIIPIGGTIGCDERYLKDARYDVVGQMVENLRNQIVKKKNDLGWHTILSAAFDRGAIVADGDASQGTFTPRLVSLMKTIMRRNGGGNSTSNNRSILTDLFTSPEAIEDMRSWNVDVVDEITRREIFTAADGRLNRIFNVNIHDIDELGEGQEYQVFWESTLGATMPTTGLHQDVEICVGLDLSKRNSLVMPVEEEMRIMTEDSVRHRLREWFASMYLGFAVCDSRVVLAGSY